MTEYIPSTEDVKRQFYWGTPPPPGDLGEYEFDRWLADVKAEAWDEGRATGQYYGNQSKYAQNPYRMED